MLCLHRHATKIKTTINNNSTITTKIITINATTNTNTNNTIIM